MDELHQIMESSGMWAACSLIIVAIIVQAVGFFKIGMKGSKEYNMDQEKVKQGVKSSMLTAVGPTLAQVVILVSLLAVLGTPNSFMRINDIGAPRSELTQIANAASIYGVEVGKEGFTTEVFTAALWAMAIVNGGWMIVALLSAKRMGSLVETMNARFSQKWTKMIMSGTMTGLFAYLVINSTVGKSALYWVAAGIAAVVIYLIKKLFKNNSTMKSISLGLAMLVSVIIVGIVNAF